MSGYNFFSEYYDILTEDVDYKGRTEYLCGLFKRFGAEPRLLLDLACGTGGFTFSFLEKGIDVIGVDPSEEMLAVAREKAAKMAQNPLFLCQSGQTLDLYGTVDGAVCCLDSINHIIDREDLLETFRRVSLFLEKDKLFIFDVNTPYKHKNILGDNSFVRETEDMFLVWQNSTDEDGLTDIYLDFFIKKGDTYIRESEDFSERAYSDSELREMLCSAGLEVLAVFGDMTDSAPAADSERNIYVTRKV